MAKLKIQLKQLERQVPEGTFLVGEQYFREGRVEQLRELDRGLWQARVRLDRIYDLEVLLRGDKVSEFYCDCSLGNKHLACPHLVAFLLMLRGFKDQQQEIKRQKNEAKLPVLQIRTLLNHISTPELHQFVREWAKEEPSFSQALKARFFTKINRDNPEHYLDALFQSCFDSDDQRESGPKLYKEVIRLFRQILAQASGLIEQSEENPGYDLLLYLCKLVPRFDSDRLKTTAIKGIMAVLDDESLQDELRPDSARFGFLQTCFGIMVSIGEEKAANRLLLHLQAYTGYPEARNSILDLMRNTLVSAANLQVNPEPLVLVYYQNLPEEKRKQAWLDSLNLPRMGPSFYERMASTLMDTGDFDGCKRMLNYGQSEYPASAELLRLQIQLHWELHEAEPIPVLAQKLLLGTLSGADVDFLSTVMSKEAYLDFSDSMIDSLQDGNTYDHHQLACIFMARSGGWKKLAKRVIQSGSIRLLDKYSHDLQSRYPDQYKAIITEFIDGYLDKHVGPQAKQIIRKVLALLRKQELDKVIDEMINHLQTRYPHRSQLLEDLDKPERFHL